MISGKLSPPGADVIEGGGMACRESFPCNAGKDSGYETPAAISENVPAAIKSTRFQGLEKGRRI
jgi:hypothetical protein